MVKVCRFRDIYVYVMYYVYVTSGPSLLIEFTDSMIYNSIGLIHTEKSDDDLQSYKK